MKMIQNRSGLLVAFDDHDLILHATNDLDSAKESFFAERHWFVHETMTLCEALDMAQQIQKRYMSYTL